MNDAQYMYIILFFWNVISWDYDILLVCFYIFIVSIWACFGLGFCILFFFKLSQRKSKVVENLLIFYAIQIAGHQNRRPRNPWTRYSPSQSFVLAGAPYCWNTTFFLRLNYNIWLSLFSNCWTYVRCQWPKVYILLTTNLTFVQKTL